MTFVAAKRISTHGEDTIKANIVQHAASHNVQQNSAGATKC
jgi:hypothetical protein